MTKKARKAAHKVNVQLKGMITFESLSKYAREQGFDVIFYSEAQELFVDLKVEEKAKKSNSFIYEGKLIRAIFIDDNKHEDLFLLLHELGHHLLGHSLDTDTKYSVTEENEANRFAELVLQGKQSKKTLIIAALSAVVIIGTAFAFYLGQDKEVTPVPHRQQQIRQEERKIINDEVGQVYAVTRTGDKYHLPDCQYVCDKSNNITLTLDEAVNMGYEPCKICIEK